MTTKIKTVIVEDLTLPNEVYNINEEFEIAGIEFLIDEKTVSKNEDINLILNQYVYNKVEEELSNFKIWLVLISSVVDNKVSQYKISQHKKFWDTSMISKLEAEKFSYYSDDIIVDKLDNRLILSSVFEVNKTSFDYAIKTLKENACTTMFISSNENFTSVKNIKKIYKSFHINHPPLKGLKYFENDIFIRTGVIEEFGVPFIDFFLSTSQLSKMNFIS